MRSQPLLIAALASHALGQFVNPPPNDTFTTISGPLGVQVRYKQVETGPGSICEQNASVVSYSGYVDVSEHEHIFFWFFGAKDIRPEDAPLTAWISGGPGDSSMSELFTEHGPCSIDENLDLHANSYAWNAFSNVIYIDQPVTVGFSYTDAIPVFIDQSSCDIVQLEDENCPGYSNDNCENYGSGSACGTFPKPDARYAPSGTEGAAPTFYAALQGIFAAFPEYTRNGFTLSSESYGGHYVPMYSRYIAEQNRKPQNGTINIPQTSILIGNGRYDPAVGYAAMYQFLVDPSNTYDVTIGEKAAETMNSTLNGPFGCLEQLAICNSPQGSDTVCKIADDFCTNNVQYIYDNETGRDEYDVREKDPSPFIPGYYVGYLNQESVMRELGVMVNYTDESQTIVNTFGATGDDGKELGITQALVDLLDSGVAVTLFHGDADYNCNWYGGEVMADRVARASTTAGLKDAYASAGYQNLSTSDGIVYGQVKQAGLLSFVRVYEAGHQVGFFQPLAQQTIFERTIKKKDVATGLIDVSRTDNGTVYWTTGPAKSTYREGSRTVQTCKVPEDAVYDHKTNQPVPRCQK